MKVSEVRNIVQEWIGSASDDIEKLHSSHIIGSLTRYDDEDEFPENTDVDIVLVIDQEIGQHQVDLPYKGMLRDNDEILYKGISLECVYISRDLYEDANQVLCNSTIVHYLRKNTILLDKDGFLGALSSRVERDFALEKFVLARCEHQLQLTNGFLQKLADENNPFAKVFSQSWAGSFLTGMLAEAHLTPPTHRRTFIQAKELLKSDHERSLYKEIIDLMGYGKLKESQVLAHFGALKEMFQLAVSVNQMRTPFSFKVREEVMPVYIGGIDEMLADGYPHESMFWIITGLFVTFLIIQSDAPEELKASSAVSIESLLEDLQPTDRIESDLAKLTESVYRYSVDQVKASPLVIH
ncbi:MAG: hypothetical protein AAGB46_03405 [Verrucomicrobiota bacterium]